MTIKRIIILILLLLAGADLLAQNSGKVKTLVIDAGHGGKDPGALGKKYKAKDIALSIALKLGNYIKANCPGVKIIYTRKTDVFVTLGERGRIAIRNKADLFISIHINSTSNKTVHGTNTYYFGQNTATKDVALLENSAVRYEDDFISKFGKQNDLAEAVEKYCFDNGPKRTTNDISCGVIAVGAAPGESSTEKYISQSKIFATKIQKEFETRANRTNRGVQSARYQVLHDTHTQMPSVLIECGFISNEAEEKYLGSDNGQNIIASAIFRAFRDYNGGTSAAKTSSTQNNANVYFCIQLKSSSKKIPLTSNEFKGITGIKEIYMDGAYKYVVGKETSFDKITLQQKEIRKKIPEAFIIAIKNGNKKISIDEAKKILK